jgi:hypothetical protein
MNFELQQPKQVISLASSALIVSVEVNVWTATKQDRQISNEVTTLKNATSESGKFTKNLLSNSPKHKALLNHRQTVYNWLQRCTYDWAGKMRLLPQVGLEKFMKEFNELEKDFKALYLDFKAEYPSMVSDAAFKQGDMFDRTEYPEPDLLDTKFRMRLLVTQVPKSDFRSSISSVIADDLTSHYEDQVKEIIDRAMADASERLVLFASRISNACTEAEAGDDGKVKRKKIYESTISQAKEICDTLKAFNLTNNAEIETARQQLEAALDGVSLEDLRESSYVRATVKESVDDMLSKFQPLKVMYD